MILSEVQTVDEPRMKDIAKMAGVSTATVGRVLHDNGYVSDDARERVNAAIKKLGYVPNRNARALTTKRSGIIGSIFMWNDNNLFQAMNHSLAAAAERRGYKLLPMQISADTHNEFDLIRQMLELRVDGLAIISDKYVTEEQFELMRLRALPVVAIERNYPSKEIDNIYFKDFDGAYESTMRFIKAGHRRIAFLGPKPFDKVEADRLEGFRWAMMDAGVPREEQIICQLPGHKVEMGEKGMDELLDRSDRPTAVFCTADMLAAGAMQALYRRGLNVPWDMSISGYDNVIARYLSPAINSMVPDLADLGDIAIAMLEKRIRDFSIPAQAAYLPFEYVDRGTIKAI